MAYQGDTLIAKVQSGIAKTPQEMAAAAGGATTGPGSAAPAPAPLASTPTVMPPVAAPPTATTAGTTTGGVPTNSNLSAGSTDTAGVSALQKSLVQQGYLTQSDLVGGEGTYGPKTTAAVAKMQQALGVNAGTAAGMYGPQTRAALQAKYGASPQDAGAAKSAISQTATKPQDTSAVDTFMSQDPSMQNLFKTVNDYVNSQNSTTSVMDDYNKIYKDSGKDKIDQEMIDAETVINGTEDDIRNEIQGAGGTGTESQIQAMALSRNKNLLKRYNSLVQQQTNAQNQINTLTQISSQDKQLAQTKANNQLQAVFKMADFAQQAQNNIQEQARWLTTNLGADGLYNAYKGDPRQLGFLEKALGLPSGGLESAAVQAATERTQKAQEATLDTKLKQAQISNIYSEIDKRNNPDNVYGTVSGKPQNATQSSANSYANRLNEAAVTLDKLGSKFASPTALGGVKDPVFGIGLPNFLKTADRQSYEQAQKNFITAVLRRESGASISPSEFETAAEIYFPQPGNPPSVVAQKERTRNTVINNMYHEADMLRPVLPGATITSGGKKYIVGPSGELKPV